MRLCVTVPASSANLGPGFDILGIALQLYNKFYAELPEKIDDPDFATGFFPSVTGLAREVDPDAEATEQKLSSDNNIFWTSYNHLFQKLNLSPVPIKIEAEIEVPLSRGLGSSSTAILAGLFLANEAARRFFDSSFSASELIYMAIEIEGHSDNIGPAALGGCQLCIPDKPPHLINLEWNLPTVFMTIVPHRESSTSESRKQLPDSISVETMKQQASRVALLTALCTKKTLTDMDKKYLSKSFKDNYHQPIRSTEIPEFQRMIKYWLDNGAIGGYISGSGSTLVCVCERDRLLSPKTLLEIPNEVGYPCSIRAIEIDRTGLQIDRL
jgi:homoserine kinase